MLNILVKNRFYVNCEQKTTTTKKKKNRNSVLIKFSIFSLQNMILLISNSSCFPCLKRPLQVYQLQLVSCSTAFSTLGQDIIMLHLANFFYTSVSLWSFTGVWGTVSLLISPGLFSVFWPICCLDDLSMFSDFQLLPPPFQAFRERFLCANYSCYHRHFHVPQFLCLWSAEKSKSTIRQVLFFVNYHGVWFSGWDYYYYYYYCCCPLRVFFASVSWWVFF